MLSQLDVSNLCMLLDRDLNKIADGMGSKFGRFMYSILTFFAGYGLGFAYIWQMTLVMMATLPIMAICGALLAKVSEDRS